MPRRSMEVFVVGFGDDVFVRLWHGFFMVALHEALVARLLFPVGHQRAIRPVPGERLLHSRSPWRT